MAATLFGTSLAFFISVVHWRRGVILQAYWIGPLIGGALAAILYEQAFAMNHGFDKLRSFLSRSDYCDEQFDDTGRRAEYIDLDGGTFDGEPVDKELSRVQKKNYASTGGKNQQFTVVGNAE